MERRSAPYSLRHDQRPLSQKPHQVEYQKYIADYIKQLQPDSALTFRSLQSPSAKDFAFVVLALMNSIDPTSYKIQGKLDEEIPKLFKRLGYPFPLSKHSLLAVGAPNSWPSLLGALVWLTDLANDLGRLHTAEDKSDPESSRMMKAYQRFLNGEDFAEEIEHWCREVQRQAEATANEIQMMTTMTTTLKEEKKVLQDSAINFDALDKEIAIRKQHIECFASRDHNLQKKQHFQKELAELTPQVEAATETAAANHDRLTQVKQAVEQQVHSAEKIDRSQQKIGGFEETCAVMRERKQELQTMRWEFEQQLTERIAKIKVQVQQYNALAAELTNSPIEFYVDQLHQVPLDESQLLSPSNYSELFVNEYEALQNSLNSQIARMAEEQPELACQYEDKKALVKSTAVEIARLRQETSTNKQLASPQITQMLDSLKTEAADLKREVEESRTDNSAVSQALSVKNDQIKKVRDEIRDCVDLAAEQESICKELIARAKEALQSHHAKMRQFREELIEWSVQSLENVEHL